MSAPAPPQQGGPAPASEPCPSNPNLAGVVVGCILATLAVVGVIIGIVLLVRWKQAGKKARAATKTGDVGLEQAHVNPAFQDDTGATSQSASKPVNDINYAEKGFPGYVRCEEYEVPAKESAQRRDRTNGTILGPVSKPHRLDLHGLGKLKKSGSHVSLDDSFPSMAVHSSAIELSKMRSMDPEVINVPLQSQDIIGLGFNICGNLRDGIFVSQILNRGPASESGLIKSGDRILGITISFANMVYEDALTILSYASPYPVQLQVEKTRPTSPDPGITGDDYEEAFHLHHPVFRSQSMDDVSRIAKESAFRRRRAQSEMKRGSSKKRQEQEEDVMGLEEGRLRKWPGKNDFNDDVVDGGVETMAILPPASATSLPNLDVETKIHAETEEVGRLHTEAPTLGLSPKRQAEQDRKEGLRLSYEDDMPVKKLDMDDVVDVDVTTPSGEEAVEISIVDPRQVPVKDRVADLLANLERRGSTGSKSSFDEVSLEELSTQVKIDMEPLESVAATTTSSAPLTPPSGHLEQSIHLVPDVGQEVSVSSPQKHHMNAILTDHGDFIDIDLKEATPSDTADADLPPPVAPPSPPPSPSVLLSAEAADVTESSMHVLLNEESMLDRGAEGITPDVSVVEKSADAEDDEGQSEDTVQAVLKNYFSDQPSLMERLGLMTSKEERAASPPTEGDNNGPSLLPRRLGGAPGSVKLEAGENPHSDVIVHNGQALNEAKKMIRRKSSSSEEEPPHASSPSTLSSRSSSPAHLEDTTQEAAISQSSGGLTFDIPPSDFHEMAVDVPTAAMERSSKQAPGGSGVAYYVSIDDQFHGTPPGISLAGSTKADSIEGDDDKPSLVKAWELPNISPSSTLGGTISAEQEQLPPTTVAEVLTVDTETERTEISAPSLSLQMSNNNNEFGPSTKASGGSDGGLVLTSPVKVKDITSATTPSTEVSKSNDVFTVSKHEEVEGAFTLTVNASHNEDSEA